ncbi:MAG: hypothetical protein JSW33_02990 [bacterium]|nr:MAG: hypothetical protein JSW33_02990 [bacterium]
MKGVLFSLAAGTMLLVGSTAGAMDFIFKGVEVAKGRDIGDTRYGTRFVGEVLDIDGREAGYWSVNLDYIGSDEVEVCAGRNDIVRARMVVFVSDGESRGLLVLDMTDESGTPDVFWDYQDVMCGIGGFGCPYPWSPPELLCDEECLDCGPVARVGNEMYEEEGIILQRRWGTGLFRRATEGEFTGWLRHNYPFIPRVDGMLTVYFR